MNTIQKYWPVIVLIISSIAIVIALIAEYAFDILPCQMCIYQRYPYYFIIIFSVIFIVLKNIPPTLYYWITTLSFTVGLFFSTWHVGIEQNILPGLPGCSIDISKSQSLSKLKDQIINQNIITCDEVTWSFFGISAATLNSVLLIILLLINIKLLILNNYNKEKKYKD